MINVLFVDDEPAILQAFRRLLHSMGGQWNMEFLPSAAAALERMRLVTFEVVVSDMRMPGMDGAQFFAEVMRLYPQTTRILFSGMASEEEMNRAMGIAHHFVSKPCDTGQLKTLINAVAVHVAAAPPPSAALPGLPAVVERSSQVERASPEAPDIEPVRIGRATGVIIHELDNLLAIVRGFAEVLSDEVELHQAEHEAVDAILSATGRMELLSGELRTLGCEKKLCPRPM